MRLDLAIDPNAFGEQLAQEVLAGSFTIVDTIERTITEHLEDSVSKSVDDFLVKAPRAIVHPNYYTNRFENLSNLTQQGYFTWYPEIRFATRKHATPLIDAINIDGFDNSVIRYGGGIKRDYTYKVKELKTQVNHTVRLNKLSIPSDSFHLPRHLIKQSGKLPQPFIANLAAGYHYFIDDRIEGFRAVAFDHVITGRRLFCDCHTEAHAKMVQDAKMRAPSFAAGSWPHRVISLLNEAEYGAGLCHLCVAETHGEDAVTDWYGPQIQKHYGPYVDLLVRRDGMDVRTAKAEAKRRLSISRWVREDELYRLVVRLFSRATIRREASPPWLGLQRLDIYLPELKLAIEHQGEQHFRPVKAFGGESAFLKVKERDERKRKLCKEHGVAVVEIRYDTSLTLPLLRSRLQRWL